MSEDLTVLTNSVYTDEMPFIWIITACKRTLLGVTCIQRVKMVSKRSGRPVHSQLNFLVHLNKWILE